MEFAATSISSDFPIALDPVIKAADPTLNPQVKSFDGSVRGYLRKTIDKERRLRGAHGGHHRRA